MGVTPAHVNEVTWSLSLDLLFAVDFSWAFALLETGNGNRVQEVEIVLDNETSCCLL